jgi:hypothetical protein
MASDATLKRLQLPSGGGGGQFSSSTPTTQQGSLHRVKSTIEKNLSTVRSAVAYILEEDWEEGDEELEKRDEEEEVAVEQQLSVMVPSQAQDLTADIGKSKQAMPSGQALKAETVEIISELKVGCSIAKLCVVMSGVVFPINSHIVLLSHLKVLSETIARNKHHVSYLGCGIQNWLVPTNIALLRGW